MLVANSSRQDLDVSFTSGESEYIRTPNATTKFSSRDYTWMPSQGIYFGTSPGMRVRQPSCGMTFLTSNGTQAPRPKRLAFRPSRKLQHCSVHTMTASDTQTASMCPGRSGEVVSGSKRSSVTADSLPYEASDDATPACQIDELRPAQTPRFRIPETRLRDAMLSSRSTAAAYWQYSLYRGPKGEKVKVHYCKSRETTERISQLFLDQEVVGFDIEWKPQALAIEGAKKNVSLIQLASEERIALFHIARFAKDDNIVDLVAPTLKRIMENPHISKVGVSVKADCTRLRKFMGIEARGLFELSHLYKLVKFSAGNVKRIDKRLVALGQQVEEHLQLPMWKGDVRSSDWSEELSYKQIEYAASDSYAGLQLYDIMEGKRKALSPTPPRPAHAELNLPIRLANGQTVATYDEPEEVLKENVADNDQLVDMEEMAREFLDIAIEDNGKFQAPIKPKQSPPDSQKSSEIVTAEDWIRRWRSDLPKNYKSKVTPAFLRAYSLWHHQEKSVAEAAALLRDPPLQTSTVSNYILEAIRMESLPFVAGRLPDVFEHLHESIARGRYQSLRRHVV